MTSLILILPIIASFLITLFLIPFWIRKSKQIGLFWDDMNKSSKQEIAGSGGIIVIFGFIIGVLIFIAYRVFLLNDTNSNLIQTFVLLNVILMLAGIGFMDDLLGWRKGGIKRKYRIIVVAIAAIPLMAINAGKSKVLIPFLGNIDLGLFYPLILIPIGIVGATTTYNFLAGYNGEEAGQGVIILSALAIVSVLTGNPWLSIISLTMVSSLLAFLLFNFYPAKVFPGDSLTYSIGGLIAIIAILGNFERIAIFFFIPYILETILKSRGKLVKQSFGKPKKDGSLDLKYNKIYSLNHLSILIMKKLGIKPTEIKVTLSIYLFQIIIIILGFIIFNQGILT
tara:strand:+ start:914 stop:1930 length:1017 start_codon:yes stop_codon:yes gene_type:complete